MQFMLYILIVLFLAASISLLMHLYIPICKRFIMRRRNLDKKKIIKKELEVLKSNKKPKEKAAAIIDLMRVSYILVHTIINEGNKYDDKKQMKKFCNGLTPELMEKIMSLEGIDG